MLKRLRHIAVGGLSLIVGMLVMGFLYQFISTKIDDYRYPPPGKMVDIGGYRLHINCSGKGGPAVILESGIGENSLTWSLVQPNIAKFTQVCSYDRAGHGWSEESPQERTSQNIVDELHELLRQADIPPPYILVGHSFGGIIVRLYANRYPEEVVGVVLVDSTHEDQFQEVPPLPNKTFELFKGYFGITRLLQYEEPPPPEKSETLSEVHQMYIAKTKTTKFIRACLGEMYNVAKSLQQLKTSNGSLGNKPLTVITAGKFPSAEETGISQESLDEWEEKHRVRQINLVTKSRHGKQVIAEHSGHNVPIEQPEIIVEAIRKMVMDQDVK